MTKLVTVADSANFKTKAGGCRPSTPDELKHVQPLPQHIIDDVKAKHAAKVANPTPRGSWLSMYNNAFEDETQVGMGICVGCGVSVIVQGVVLFQQGIRIPRQSSPFGYLTSSNDPTFTHGSSISWSVQNRAIGPGCCADKYYPIAQVIASFNAWPGHTFVGGELPQPPAYEDAKTRRILQWHAVPKDPATIIALVSSGYPIVMGMGNHCTTAVDLSPDNWVLLNKDSEMANIDNGYGRGVRGFTMDAVMTGGYELTVATLVQPGALEIVTTTPPPPPPPPKGNTQMLIDTIKADAASAATTANGLALGVVTQAQIDALNAAVTKFKNDVALLVADTVVVNQTPPPPPPPSGAVFMPPAVQLIDAAGYVWTRGAYTGDQRYGYSLLCNGRALKASLSNALVNGKFRCNDAGTWYEFSGGPYAPVWTQTTAPS